MMQLPTAIFTTAAKTTPSNPDDHHDDMTANEDNDPFADRNALNFGKDPMGTAEMQYVAHTLPTVWVVTDGVDDKGLPYHTEVKRKVTSIPQTPGSASIIPPVINRSLGTPKIPQRPTEAPDHRFF